MYVLWQNIYSAIKGV